MNEDQNVIDVEEVKDTAVLKKQLKKDLTRYFLIAGGIVAGLGLAAMLVAKGNSDEKSENADAIDVTDYQSAMTESPKE